MACARGCCASPAEHYRSIRFSGAPSTPTLTERRWDKDHAAYRRMRANGLQPKRLDGSAELETRARSAAEVELGVIAPTDKHRRELEDVHASAPPT